MLKVKNIETWYDLIRALHGISFEIKQGDIVALLGSNGAGKTTTLKTIMRLFYDAKEEQPEKGSIEFMGERIDRKDTDDIVKMGIGYVPEGREVFPRAYCFGKHYDRRLHEKRHKKHSKRFGKRFSSFSHTERESKAAGGFDERRRTTDAGHRQGADEPPQVADAR